MSGNRAYQALSPCLAGNPVIVQRAEIGRVSCKRLPVVGGSYARAQRFVGSVAIDPCCKCDQHRQYFALCPHLFAACVQPGGDK
jgi:hypothetical protein